MSSQIHTTTQLGSLSFHIGTTTNNPLNLEINYERLRLFSFHLTLNPRIRCKSQPFGGRIRSLHRHKSLRSYCEFSELETIGNDFCKILKTCIENPQYFHKKAESVRNQQLVRFSPESNFENWKKAIQVALNDAA